MSTPTPQYGNNPPNPAAASALAPGRKREILIISHSSLFYWWPVWAVGLLMGFLTLFSGHRLATVPDKTTAMSITFPDDVKKKDDGKDSSKRDAFVLPPGVHIPKDLNHPDQPEQPHLHMS